MSTFDGHESFEETVPGEPVEYGGAADNVEALTRVGHYVLLQRLGQGGMGVVWSAYDETLDRKVAIKLLRSGAYSQPRLLREAHAMARVTHPNVVQIYETGVFEESPYIVMQYVEGETLRSWLSGTRRSAAEVLAVFEAAGRGLIAAHEKGLVHRDFKPDNVMVASDGGVLVMDFGLARGEGSVVEVDLGLSSIERSADLMPTQLTMTGAVMGTPAYMAPEQLRGLPAGPAADQFSFCVALWEALCGDRPFAGESLVALELATSSAAFAEPSRGELPSWLRKVLERGLAPDPDARWPSLDELLGALADDPTRRRRVLLATLMGLVVLVGGGSWIALAVDARAAETAAAERAAAIAACEDQGRALDGAWTEAARGELAATFAASKFGHDGDAWARTEARLGDYVEEWSRQRTRLCVEAEIEASKDPRVATLTQTCLDERRAVFEALLDAWSGADEQMVTRAPAAAAELPLVSLCENFNWLAQQIPPPDDVDTRAKVVDLRARLEQIAALGLAADYERALARAKSVLAEAEALGWAPLEVEARYAVGDLLEHRGDYEASVAELRRAFLDAGRAGHDLVALQSASKLTWTVGARQLDFEGGSLWGEIGEMFVARLGLEQTVHEAKLLNALGAMQFRGSDPRALANYERALALRRTVLGPDHPLVAATLNNIGLIELDEGRYDAALVSTRRALEIREAALGPNHPALAGSLNNMAMVLQKLERLPEALAASQRALPILEAALGADHPAVGSSLSNLGVIQEDLGRYEDALASHARGLDIKLATLGPDHASVSVSLTNMGEAQRRLGRLEQARETLERAAANANAASRLPQQRGKNAFSLAQVLDALDDSPPARRRARALAEDARRAYLEVDKSELDKLAKIDAWLAERPAP